MNQVAEEVLVQGLRKLITDRWNHVFQIGFTFSSPACFPDFFQLRSSTQDGIQLTEMAVALGKGSAVREKDLIKAYYWGEYYRGR